ncbi:MAG: hypothetical protein ACRETN_13065 [Nevskiales bacterium]
MDKRFWISVVVMFVLSFALSFVVHGLLLGQDYAPLAQAGVFRTPEASGPFFPYMVAANLLFAVGTTWIYRQGLDAGKPFLGQGLRFGLALAVLMTIPTYLIYYAVTPLPATLVVKQIVFDTIAIVFMGAAVAALNQPAKTG